MTTPQSERERRHAQNAKVIEEFRANAGEVATRGNMRVLLLTTKGAKTGQTRVNPVTYLQEGNRTFVFASKGGGPTNPDWYHNLVANPEVTVEVGKERYTATARVLAGDERDTIFAKQVSANPVFGEYEERAPRTIPVIELVRSTP